MNLKTGIGITAGTILVGAMALAPAVRDAQRTQDLSDYYTTSPVDITQGKTLFEISAARAKRKGMTKEEWAEAWQARFDEDTAALKKWQEK